MYDDNDSMLDYGNANNPIVVGGDPSLQMSGMQPKKKKWQSFLGGMQGGNGRPGGLVGGLSTLAGSGGFGGAVGNAAKFFL